MIASKPQAESTLLDSVNNALRILKCFTKEQPIRRVTELSRILGLNKSTVSRMLATLAAEGFVTKDAGSRSFRLGPSALSIGCAFKYSNEIYKEAIPVLKKLADILGETVQLATLDGMEVFFVETIECRHPLRFMSSAGSRSPIHCSSLGKVLLAFRNDNFINEVVGAGLPPSTQRTITSEREFREEISRVRKQGFALSLEERFEGVISVAAPICDPGGQAIAAVNVVGPSNRMKQENLNRCIRHLVQGAGEISSSLYY